MFLVVLALLCSSYCAGQGLVPPTKDPFPDDKTNWKEVWNVLKSDTQLWRTDGSNLSVFETIYRVNAKERANGTGRSDSNIFLFEADIVMNKSEVVNMISQGTQGSQGTSRNKRAVMRKTNSNRWRRNIRYVLDIRLSGRARTVIKTAIREWQDTLQCMGTWTDVSRRARSGRGDHMYFFSGGGCYSQVGRRGGRQKVSIGRGCEYHGIAVHEIGHAMGLWHEQSRPDRNNYVRILWKNIIPAMKFNFQKYTTARIDSFGVPYDYDSVMHYGATAFARRRGLSTIVSVKGRRTLGQRRGLSAYDKKQVKLLYGCTTVKPTGCSDKNSNCGHWKKANHCVRGSKYYKYMQDNCCKSCKPGCSDKNSNCGGWKNYCVAGKYYIYMQKNCCKTCKSVRNNCVDKSNNCRGWKNGGYCTHRLYVQYMKKNCAKSCGCI